MKVKKMTKAEVVSLIKQKLDTNFSVSPRNASDEVFYKAAAMVLNDQLSAIRADFEKRAAEQERKRKATEK